MNCYRIAGAALLVISAGCSDSSGPKGPKGIVAKISSIQTSDGIKGTIKSGIPSSGQGGPSVTVPSLMSVINGGTAAASVTSTVTYYRLAIAIDGVDDYYEVLFPSGTKVSTILITLAQGVTETSLPLSITAADVGASYGVTKHIQATVTKVGSGDVQIALSWGGASDVDLHVVGPDNDEIYWSDRSSTSGGSLDLDSNAGCSIDNVNNENVTWPSGHSLAGSYKVLVDYWSNCGVASTNYVVTITVTGRTPQIFQGTFTGGGDYGDAGSGRLITTFTK